MGTKHFKFIRRWIRKFRAKRSPRKDKKCYKRLKDIEKWNEQQTLLSTDYVEHRWDGFHRTRSTHQPSKTEVVVEVVINKGVEKASQANRAPDVYPPLKLLKVSEEPKPHLHNYKIKTLSCQGSSIEVLKMVDCWTQTSNSPYVHVKPTKCSSIPEKVVFPHLTTGDTTRNSINDSEIVTIPKEPVRSTPRLILQFELSPTESPAEKRHFDYNVIQNNTDSISTWKETDDNDLNEVAHRKKLKKKLKRSQHKRRTFKIMRGEMKEYRALDNLTGSMDSILCEEESQSKMTTMAHNAARTSIQGLMDGIRKMNIRHPQNLRGIHLPSRFRQRQPISNSRPQFMGHKITR